MSPPRKRVKVEPAINAPWCDTCQGRIVWLGDHWQHVDATWRRISKDHEPTGTAWDAGQAKP